MPEAILFRDQILFLLTLTLQQLHHNTAARFGIALNFPDLKQYSVYSVRQFRIYYFFRLYDSFHLVRKFVLGS